jgi:sodium/potassium-transporting ATPase subunit alpha
MGWWSPSSSHAGMPAAPAGLDMGGASTAYLMSLTAYFFPTVTTQIANVLCKRSWKTSIFSQQFLNPRHRQEILERIRTWRPLEDQTRLTLDQGILVNRTAGTGRLPMTLFAHWLVFPLRLLLYRLSQFCQRLEQPLFRPVMERLSRFLERHEILLNFISNPLIDLGIVFELVLCGTFFYTGLSHVYYFAPLPWPVYLFAFHGTLILFTFEETKKYYRRRGYRLNFLG